MEYRQYSPAPELRRYIHCFWTLRQQSSGATATPERIVPDGRAEVILNRAAPFAEQSSVAGWDPQPAELAVGQLSTFMQIRPTGDVDLIGIRFTASGMAELLGVPANQLTDNRVELGALQPGLARRLREAIHPPGRGDHALPRVQRCLLSALPKGGSRDELAFVATTRIRAEAGWTSVNALCHELGVDERRLERRFQATVGMPAKRFARIVRFDALLRAARHQSAPGWATLAARFGYHDQAHLIREFRIFTGLTPVAYMRAQHGLSDEFTSADQR